MYFVYSYYHLVSKEIAQHDINKQSSVKSTDLSVLLIHLWLNQFFSF